MTSGADDLVLIDRSDAVATVTLNRPDKRNALNNALQYAIWDAITELGQDPDVAAIVLTGADPAFSAGIDIKELSGEVAISAGPRAQGEGPERHPDGLFRFFPVIATPIIGADEALRLGLVNHVVAHDELLPFARRIAGDIAGNDQPGVRRLLAHYRQIANTTSLEDAYGIEGAMAESWVRDTSGLAERRRQVTARGKEQRSLTGGAQ